MKNIFKILLYPIRIIFLLLIKIYKIFISSILPKTCGFIPSCSVYMEQAIKEFGITKGIYLGIKRILKCRPNGKCGYDPVPINIKGETKWLI